MKQVIGNYVFAPGTPSVTLSDFSAIRLDRLQLIVDCTTNKILYNFADTTVATATVATNVVTLSHLQGGELNTDKLQVIYDCQTGDPTYDEIPVTLATTIAGEDIPDNRLMISNECVLSNTETQAAVSVLNGSAGTTTNANYSTAVNCANYRTYAMAGWGASGNIQLLLQVAYDGGSTWLWHPNGFTATGQQYPLQMGNITAPLCRVAAINISGSTQNITAYLCLSR